MRVLAVIPARGGSKRVPGKNLRKVGGVSLVGRAIISAQQSELITDVIVSTDCPDIKDEAWRHVSKEYCNGGKYVSIVDRPDYLCTDATPLDDVVVHCLQHTDRHTHPIKMDKVVTLQPTSPFRPQGLIDHCIQLQEAPYSSVLTVHDAGHFYWRASYTHPTVPVRYEQVNATSRVNSQFIPRDEKLWAENGCVYVTDAYALHCVKQRTVFHSMVVPISAPYTLDLDTEADFQLAETLSQTL